MGLGLSRRRLALGSPRDLSSESVPEDLAVGVFAEFFNVFNTANFGQNYQGNAGRVFREEDAALFVDRAI
jgi:hypothetical protein